MIYILYVYYYRLIRQGSDFASHMLQVLLGNTLLYMVSYLAMKLVVGERVRWYVWVLLAGATAAWLPALYFFLSGSTNWAATPAASRHSNHDCKVTIALPVTRNSYYILYRVPQSLKGTLYRAPPLCETSCQWRYFRTNTPLELKVYISV